MNEATRVVQRIPTPGQGVRRPPTQVSAKIAQSTSGYGRLSFDAACRAVREIARLVHQVDPVDRPALRSLADVFVSAFAHSPSQANLLRAGCQQDAGPTTVRRRTTTPEPQDGRAEPWSGKLKFAGSLGAIPFDQACQLVAAGEMTGVLFVFLETRRGRVFFIRGVVVAVDLEGLGDVDAFRVLSRSTQGHFAFLPGVVPATRRIEMPVVKLLLESCRTADEEGRAKTA